MLVTELSGCLHVLKCNVQALVAFHSANSGCVILDLHLCHLPRLFRRPFPRSQFTWCHFLSLRPHALASTAAQPDLSQDSALFCLLCPLRVAGSPLPSQWHRLLPQGPPTGTLPSESLWKTRRYDYICMVAGRVRCPGRAFTWPLCHQNSAINSWKQGGHSASRKRRRLQNSWILLP